MDLQGKKEAAILDESTGEWIPFELNLDDPEELAQFLRGEFPKKNRGSMRSDPESAHRRRAIDGECRAPSAIAARRPAAHPASGDRPARADG